MLRNVFLFAVGAGLALGLGALTGCFSPVGEPNADGTLGAPPAPEGARLKPANANGTSPDPGVAADQGDGSDAGDDAGPAVMPDAGSPDLDAGPPADDAGLPGADDAGPPAADDAGASDDAGSPAQGGCAPGRAAPYFNAPVAVGTAGDGFALASADFNGDGLPDLVVGDSSQVEVYLALDGGGFADPVGYAGGYGPSSAVAVDLNGDGATDIAVANNYDNSVSVFLNNGDGTFGAQTSISVSAFPYEIAAQDLNGDGKVDLLVASSQEVDLLFNQGGGSFASPVSLGSSAYNWGLATVDVNQDGLPDIEVANRENTSVDIYVADGDGGFATAVSYATQPEPNEIVIADFNGDGQPDLAVGNWGDGTNGSVSLWLGQGGGSFGTRTDFPAVAGGVHSMVVADFNGDCLLDIAAAGYDSAIDDCANANGGVVLLLNDGDGGFGTAIAIPSGGIAPLELVQIILPGSTSPSLAVTQNVCGGPQTLEILSTTGP